MLSRCPGHLSPSLLSSPLADLSPLRLDFNSDDEKMLIEQVFMNAIEALSDDDRRLPQVETLLPLLKKGVGIHHGGLLPILKEIIEILFQVSSSSPSPAVLPAAPKTSSPPHSLSLSALLSAVRS
jgi:hypothetical protein